MAPILWSAAGVCRSCQIWSYWRRAIVHFIADGLAYLSLQVNEDQSMQGFKGFKILLPSSGWRLTGASLRDPKASAVQSAWNLSIVEGCSFASVTITV